MLRVLVETNEIGIKDFWICISRWKEIKPLILGTKPKGLDL
jgi:hypothetical protein